MNLSKMLILFLMVSNIFLIYFIFKENKNDGSIKEKGIIQSSNNSDKANFSEANSANKISHFFLTLKEIGSKNNFYKKDDEVNKVLSGIDIFTQKKAFDLFFLINENYEGIFLPEKNIYCFGIESEQTKANYEFYSLFMSGVIEENLLFFGDYSDDVFKYFNNQEDYKDGEFGRMLGAINKNKDTLLSLYKNNETIKFKRKIFEINGGVGNHDILTMLFLEKNGGNKGSAIDFLNKCFDYKTKTLNKNFIKEAFYLKLSK